MKKVAISQSNYIPWKGYFDLIASVDQFILYDDMQYTRRDWRNRNKVKTPQGTQWLTVPVKVKGRYHQKINETLIDGTDWAKTHWDTLQQFYRRAPHFSDIAQWLEPIYLTERFTHLSGLNSRLIIAICDFLGIDTKISSSSDYVLIEGKTERLAELCTQVGATVYCTGPAAKGYLDESVFQNYGIDITWYDYSGYREYSQLWGPFVHHVTILDVLFNCGKKAPDYLRHVKT